MSTAVSFIIIILVITVTFNVFYLTFFGVLSVFRSNKVKEGNKHLYKYGVMVIAYKNDKVILESVTQNLLQNYSKDKFDIIVVGDGLLPETIATLKQMPLKIIELHLPYPTKANSIRETENLLCNSDYDYVVLLDIDNVMEVDFLKKLNNEIEKDIPLIQTHRMAKNLDTPIAILDAFSEEINNSIFRQGHQNIGLQTALIGSGIVFERQFFLSDILNIQAVGGYDKEIELLLAKQKLKTKYCPTVNLYDEKTRFLDDLNKQRTRWFSAQFFYLRKNVLQSIYQMLFKGNINYVNKILQFTLLPKIFTLVLCFIMPFITYFFYEPLFVLSVINAIAIIITASISLPRKFYSMQYFSALQKLPLVFFSMVKGMTKLKGANRSFIATPHHTDEKENNK
ncbi:MAG: glycosyltransferase family 2 protein [Bacteroidota bacterium]